MSVPSQWKDVMGEVQDILVDNSVLIRKHADESEKADLMEEMSTIMKEVCEANKNFTDQKRAVNFCQNINTEEGSVVDYNFEYQKQLTEIKKAGKKYKVESDQLFIDFKEKVDDLTSNDFEIEESDMNFLDPITKQTMSHPVKSQSCGHVFDKTSIESMFKCSRDPCIRCPYIGCPNKLSKKDIKEDEVLSQKFQRFLNTQNNTEE